MARIPFSKVALDVYAYILGYYTDNGYMPTCPEIATKFSTPEHSYTKEWARFVLKELARQKKIKINKYKHRGIQLI